VRIVEELMEIWPNEVCNNRKELQVVTSANGADWEKNAKL